MATKPFAINEWDGAHPRWPDLMELVARLKQTDWVNANYEWHRSSYMLVAQRDSEIAGFLRFVVQDIGAEDDHDPVTLDGSVLSEAKVLAFGVAPAYRRQGVGRVLQEQTLQHAARLGCYQLRSHSSGQNDANHRLKLAMGFAVHPIIRGEDRGGVYFIMPLAR